MSAKQVGLLRFLAYRQVPKCLPVVEGERVDYYCNIDSTPPNPLVQFNFKEYIDY